MKFPSPPGVFDIIPVDEKEPWKSSYLWSYLEEHIRSIAEIYGFREIRTPLFERTELFQRSVGETSDIVTKEMYTFLDKGGRSLSLRPEGTAPAMRAFIEHHLHAKSSIQKLFYISSMFRYERSQAGRYRQHHQFGAEAIGIESPEQDAEIIDMLFAFYRRIGLKNLALNINSIGNIESRQRYRDALRNFLHPQRDLLSNDSQERLETNPLRILDSKDPRDQQLILHAPSILDHLDEESLMHFEELKRLLEVLKIPYKINPSLVRGLDYYNKTVFEVVAGELGSQNSIGGGGRYDSLLEELGGPKLPAIGFGTGIERVIQTMLSQEISLPRPTHPSIFIIPLGKEAEKSAFEILHTLREKGISSQMDYTKKKVGKALQYADQLGATYALVIGDHEIESQEVEIKELATGKKLKIPLSDLSEILKLELKTEQFIQEWESMLQPFKSETQKKFFIDKVGRSIGQTKEFAVSVHSSLDHLQKLVDKE